MAAHGVRGEVRIKPLTDFPDRLLETAELYTDNAPDGGLRRYTVEAARRHGKGMYVLKLAGVDDRDAAEALRRKEVRVAREDAVPLPEGSYYVFELVGATVYTSDGDVLGTLVDVITTGANDVYEVRDERGKEVLIPALRDVVRRIDPESGTIVVDLPPGLD